MLEPNRKAPHTPRWPATLLPPTWAWPACHLRAARRPPAAQVAVPPFELLTIPRSREVGQSYATSVLTTLYAIAHAFWLVRSVRPELVGAGVLPANALL